MKLIFGLHLDELTAPRSAKPEMGIHYCGPKKLLALLETHFGLLGHADDIDFLRVEQYRQAILAWQSQSEHSESFLIRSFEADQFATSAELLSRRDELRLAGFEFSPEDRDGMPERFRVLTEIEAIFQDSASELELTAGFADRFCEVLEKMAHPHKIFEHIRLNEPLDMMPCHFQRLFKKLGEHTAIDFTRSTSPVSSETDLQKLQSRLFSKGGKEKKIALESDGSLLLVRAKRANEAANFMAQTLRLNPAFRPTCLVPEKNRTLDIALVKEGLPSLGIQSASLARPVLQILKLAPTFLWNPIDPFKILEFVSLAVKPLPEELSERIGEQIARSPGLKGEGWYAMVNRYFSELEKAGEKPKVIAAQREQYNFWFERSRHRMDGTVPKREVLDIFIFLRNWAKDIFEESAGKKHSLLVLSEQCRRIVELLEALPERDLGFLQLERIVRTIYEPSPVVFQERERGHLPYVTNPGAFTDKVEAIMWWNFVLNEPPHFFSRWYQFERDFLSEKGIHLDTPSQQNDRAIWHRNQPVLMAQNRLVLVIPEMIDGTESLPHPLLGDMEAAFSNLEDITIDVGDLKGNNGQLILPQKEQVELQRLGRPKPFIQLENVVDMEREYESLTSLESLFYYPYQWMFRYKAGLRASSILSVVKDHTLMGNLAHRIFEELLKKEDFAEFEKEELDKWVASTAQGLFLKEGAVLLMYGREPERIAFVNKLKYSAWSLVSHLRENGWSVRKTEMDLEGHFPTGSQKDVRGIADLVLEREGVDGEKELAVVDLKWRGAARRTSIIKNEEDLQLVLYAQLLSENGKWPHTAYFIIENGKFIARNNLAFKGITPLAPEADHEEVNGRILSLMEATWKWRMGQLNDGQIEIRCRQTLSEIEEIYGEKYGSEMMEILEMKSDDAPWDDYRVLIDLVE